MKMTLLKIMIYITSLISTLKTPMSMGILLLIQTTLSTILISKLTMSSWMAMIIFLMLIGGLLILFMYMSSIASNEKFTPNIFMIFPIMLIFLPMEEMMCETQMNEKLQTFMLNESITLMKIYNKKTMLITIMLFSYLLLAMISITSVIKIYKGPLRSK
uniref:NADH dehydrogenase subunit 6 n=1 Tax=Changbaninus pleiospicules TaxID=2914790 RepID=UPI001EF9CA85|nr:NADH dehydrogenase subunit 6 [Changbaninus pleiospicules]UKE80323.1 NADH dehydrogenase subunit 6 [Changbaninus pleiospicules]